MAMTHVETTISEKSIRMRLANDTDPMKATEWIEFSIPSNAKLTLPADGAEIPLGSLDTGHLASIREAALRYVREAIVVETRRLSTLANP